jgi:hypothetical protein
MTGRAATGATVQAGGAVSEAVHPIPVMTPSFGNGAKPAIFVKSAAYTLPSKPTGIKDERKEK